MGAVWLRSPNGSVQSVLPWQILFALAMASAFFFGVIGLQAAVALLVLYGTAHYASQTNTPAIARRVAFAITVVLALALATHRVPGFHNPVVIDAVIWSAGAASFSQHANFDKGAVGLLLLAFMCQRSSSVKDAWVVLKKTIPATAITLAVVMLAGCFSGYIAPDFKFSWSTIIFLVVNLFFTVIAEEAFFRGLIQSRLDLAMKTFRFGRVASVLGSGVLFGAAHAGGGPIYVALATLAGIGYAYLYARTSRIEAPIFAHFSLNTIHVLFFTFPHLAR